MKTLEMKIPNARAVLLVPVLLGVLVSPAAGQQPAAPLPSTAEWPTAPTAETIRGAGLIGADVYVTAPDADQEVIGDTLPAGWEDVGDVDDLLLDSEGRVTAVVTDIGGFLGIGAKTVAIPFDTLRVMQGREGDAATDVSVVLPGDRGMLEGAPEFSDPRDGLDTATDATPTDAPMTTEPTPSVEPTPMEAPEGYALVGVSEVSAEDLEDAAVVGENQERIGEIGDVVIGADGTINAAVIDVGGFLGIGSKAVAVDFNDLAILRNTADESLEVRINMDEDALREMPAYEGAASN